MTTLLEYPSRCKRCDPDARCADCAAVEARRALCDCTHPKAIHHNNMGCLGFIQGQLCRCNRFEQMPEGGDE